MSQTPFLLASSVFKRPTTFSLCSKIGILQFAFHSHRREYATVRDAAVEVVTIAEKSSTVEQGSKRAISAFQVLTVLEFPISDLATFWKAVTKYDDPRSHVRRRAPHLVALEDRSQLYHTRTAWIARTLASGAHIPTRLLARLLDNRNISPDVLEIWVEVLARKDLIFAVSRLGLLESGGEGRERVACPEWLMVTLPALLTSHHQVAYLLSVLSTKEFRRMNLQNQGILIARSIQAALRVGHWVAVREMVEWFCRQEREHQSTTYAEIFTALGSHPTRASSIAGPSQELLVPLVRMLRRTMKERKVKMTLEVYWPLFNAAIIPSDHVEATNLLVEMEADGIEIHVELIHSVMRVYARKGRADGAKVLYESIQEVRRRRDRNLFGPRRKGISWSELDKETKEDIQRSSEEEYETMEKERNELEMVAIEEDEAKDPTDLLDDAEQLLSSHQRPHIESTITEQRQQSAPRFNTRIRSNAIYQNTRLNSLSSDLRQAMLYFDTLRSTSNINSNRRHLSQIDTPTWTTLLSIAAKSSFVSSDQLLSLLRRYEDTAYRSEGVRFDAEHHVARPTTRMYTVVMNGLNERDQPEDTLSIWDTISANGYAPDAFMLTSLANALITLGRVEEAERLIVKFALPPGGTRKRLPRSGLRLRSLKGQYTITPDEGISARHSKYAFARSIPIDIVPLNTLMSGYNRAGHYITVWDIFHRMETDFGVAPDAASLSILLDTARFASAAAGRGYGPGDERLAGEYNDGAKPYQDDNWNGGYAWQRAEAIMKQVLEGNWPEMKLEDPLSGATAAGGLTASERNGFDWSTLKRKLLPSLSPSSATPTTTLRPRPFAATLGLATGIAPQYPQIYPTPRVFLSLIQLLGYHSTPHAVIPILAWMKALDSKPTRRALALAMLYWGEAGGSDRDRENLQQWLANWLGEDSVPREEEIARLRRGGSRR